MQPIYLLAACMRQGVCILRFGSHAARCDTALWTFTLMCTRSLARYNMPWPPLYYFGARTLFRHPLTAAALFSAPCTKFNSQFNLRGGSPTDHLNHRLVAANVTSAMLNSRHSSATHFKRGLRKFFIFHNVTPAVSIV